MGLTVRSSPYPSLRLLSNCKSTSCQSLGSWRWKFSELEDQQQRFVSHLSTFEPASRPRDCRDGIRRYFTDSGHVARMCCAEIRVPARPMMRSRHNVQRLEDFCWDESVLPVLMMERDIYIIWR